MRPWQTPLSDEAKQHLAVVFARLKADFEAREREMREFVARKRGR